MGRPKKEIWVLIEANPYQGHYHSIGLVVGTQRKGGYMWYDIALRTPGNTRILDAYTLGFQKSQFRALTRVEYELYVTEELRKTLKEVI